MANSGKLIVLHPGEISAHPVIRNTRRSRNKVLRYFVAVFAACKNEFALAVGIQKRVVILDVIEIEILAAFVVIIAGFAV